MKEVFNLWDKVPGYNGEHVPTIDYYKAQNKKGQCALIIFAGGAYCGRSAYEDEGYATYFSQKGIDCFVVNYRVSPNHFPYPLLDARRAIRFVRANAEKFGVDKNKIAVMGSSAGGHLAALVSTYFKSIDGEGVDQLDKIDCRPNAQILCYPVIDYLGHKDSFDILFGCDAESFANEYTPTHLCDEKTPPLFLWHTDEDGIVDVTNSYRYATRLHQLKVPCELHIYPYGAHGLALATDTPYVHNWTEHLLSWLKLFGFID